MTSAGGGVDQHTRLASHHLDPCLAGGNPLSPDLMSADERLSEVAQILAAGLVRLRQREVRNDCSTLEKNSLDFPPDRSVHGTARRRRKIGR
jgi:hypothetical protein